MAHLIQSLYNTVLCWLNIKWLKFWVRNRVVAWSPSSHLIPLRLIPQSSKHGFGVPLGYTSEFQTILTLTLTLSAISPSIFHECTMKFPRVYETCVCSVVSNLFVIPWTVAHQALLSMGFPREEYWSGFPFPPPGAHPNPGTEPTSPALGSSFFTTVPSGRPSTRRMVLQRSTV